MVCQPVYLPTYPSAHQASILRLYCRPTYLPSNCDLHFTYIFFELFAKDLSEEIIFANPVKYGLRCVAGGVASDKNFTLKSGMNLRECATFHVVGTGGGIILNLHYL